MAHDIYDDHEQSERVRKWLSENGSSLVIGLLAAIAAWYGWEKYQSFSAEQKVDAALTYSGFKTSLSEEQLDSAEVQLDQLREHYSDTVYGDLASLRLAAEQVKQGQLEKAANTLQSVLASTNTGMSDMARLRLARVRIAQDQAQQALNLIDALPKSEELAAVVAEVRGDALLRLGRADEARAAYEAAVAAVDGAPRQALEMKLDHLTAADAQTAAEEPSNS